MVTLADFYQKPLYERALAKYAEVAKICNWQIKNKLKIYQWAKEAFDSDLDEHHKRRSFNNIYEELWRYWQVFRSPALSWLHQ